MKSISKHEFYAIMSSAIVEGLADAPHLDAREREVRATTIAAKMAQRFYEPRVQVSKDKDHQCEHYRR